MNEVRHAKVHIHQDVRLDIGGGQRVGEDDSPRRRQVRVRCRRASDKHPEHNEPVQVHDRLQHNRQPRRGDQNYAELPVLAARYEVQRPLHPAEEGHGLPDPAGQGEHLLQAVEHGLERRGGRGDSGDGLPDSGGVR
ncbi:hypothetical protein DRH14_01720 [Candidatus Shapirobacteria bacterium]|nr:MAG: hypothetical protein DRH14_01720 [Candidatus Shapirobacteria bacterium]